MDFSLNEKQKMLKKVTREFAEKYIAPVAQESDHKQELDPIVIHRFNYHNHYSRQHHQFATFH